MYKFTHLRKFDQKIELNIKNVISANNIVFLRPGYAPTNMGLLDHQFRGLLRIIRILEILIADNESKYEHSNEDQKDTT